MKSIYIKQSILTLLGLCLVVTLITSCEQEELEPEMNAAPGGGTISTYKAYTIDAAPGSEVHGRIVFWQDNAGHTLIQLSLTNTDEGTSYPSAIFDGAVAEASTIKLEPLYDIDGATGSFNTSKFYIISDKEFFESLDTYDAHVSVLLDDDIIATGDVGVNADPVAIGE
ncbi:hypothetical protein [Dawidia soli]|uniref:CHRD domain-containing protein n=1 Tax=Dawidia soli TaxID=2782352 RepID=A0AAP2D6S1_9BACT|nr:hypothetical protein [Dawidia soli]MBT1685065.1 hypothetical protein [Dawidia soli]